MGGASKERQVVVAQFGGSHGVRGEFKLRSFTENPLRVFAYGPMRTPAGHVLTPELVREIKPGVFLCRDPDIDSPEACERFKGALLSVPRGVLPPAEDDDEFYVEDLIGLRAYTAAGRLLGEVRAVPNYGAGDIVEILGDEGTLLVPFTRDAVPEVDLDQRRLTVVLPDDDGSPPMPDA